MGTCEGRSAYYSSGGNGTLVQSNFQRHARLLTVPDGGVTNSRQVPSDLLVGQSECKLREKEAQDDLCNVDALANGR